MFDLKVNFRFGDRFLKKTYILANDFKVNLRFGDLSSSVSVQPASGDEERLSRWCSVFEFSSSGSREAIEWKTNV
jgi:hypothetical protein